MAPANFTSNSKPVQTMKLLAGDAVWLIAGAGDPHDNCEHREK